MHKGGNKPAKGYSIYYENENVNHHLAKYYKGEKTEENGMGGTFSTYGKMRNTYKILIGKPEEKRPFKRPI
jgi:hypothetical protein